MISCYKLTGMELEQVAEVLAIPYLEITYRVCLFVCVCVCVCVYVWPFTIRVSGE